jgi:rare lipoprotein A (peptidoglycan hydrolase)
VARATHGAVHAASLTRAHLTSSGSARAVDPADSQWALPVVIVAGYAVTTPTTTTTVPPPKPAAIPVVHHVTPTTTTTVPPHPATSAAPAPPASGNVETGEASWYQATPGTCASPDLPFGTVVTVTNLSSGASVTCTIDDREARNPGRVIDMSEQTFAQLADPSVGLIEVSVRW